MGKLTMMLDWLRRRFRTQSPLEQWSVHVDGGVVHTDDDRGDVRQIDVPELTRVVVATDDSGPWGADVVFLLYAADDELKCWFPLEAEGCKDFVAWLSAQSGYNDRALSQAMASTRVARFEVFRAE